jgi:hypothetical protein
VAEQAQVEEKEERKRIVDWAASTNVGDVVEVQAIWHPRKASE